MFHEQSRWRYEFRCICKAFWNDKYDYRHSLLLDVNIPIAVICIKCQILFSVLPSLHIRWKNPIGCPKCDPECYKITKLKKSKYIKRERNNIITRTLTHQEFLNRAFLIYGNEFKYLTEYTGYNQPITIQHNRCGYIFT